MYTSTSPSLCSGRIRNTPEPEEEDNDSSVLSLGLFPGEYLEIPGDDRCMFRFEAAWDSSLHNSVLLNRVTSYGEQIFMTISAYLEVNLLFHISNAPVSQ
jgi:kinesin family protein 1